MVFSKLMKNIHNKFHQTEKPKKIAKFLYFS